MSWSVWLSLSLSCLPAVVPGRVLNTERCQSLEQPEKRWRNSGQSVSLPCQLSSACQSAGFQFQWFVFKQQSHHQLNLTTSTTSTPKYRLDGASLNIKSLDVNESGIYYCVAVLHGKHEPGAQMIGLATTLTVREDMSMVISISIWLPFALLTVYSLAVIILIFYKKNGHVICSRGSGRTVHQHDSATRMQFRAVVQEFSRGNLRRTRHQKDQRGPSQSKAEDPQSNSPTDDIYQNL